MSTDQYTIRHHQAVSQGLEMTPPEHTPGLARPSTKRKILLPPHDHQYTTTVIGERTNITPNGHSSLIPRYFPAGELKGSQRRSYTPVESESGSEQDLIEAASPLPSEEASDNRTSMYDSADDGLSNEIPATLIRPQQHQAVSVGKASGTHSTASSDAAGIKRSASPEHDWYRRKRPTSYHSALAQQRRYASRASRNAGAHIISPQIQQLARTATDPMQFVPKPFDTSRVDSGYISRTNTLKTQPTWPNNASHTGEPITNPVSGFISQVPNQQGWQPTQIVRQNPYNMLLQPPLGQVTQEQLAAEVKGIYAGLVMVEAKSINIDAEQAADRSKKLEPEQWQQLIALRRTLLYEHHDFLMATQHPVANPALRALAAKYCMPARMWKHGIHGFLEVLRHRRPESQEYMLTFIYLAYDMMALLFETVPAFTDTWIECLGDLARYRMAIEEDKEVHAIWGGVAGRWYTMASDRHPQIGRLYHHLGILERPSLRKLYFYGRSLTSVVPFINARESLGTLCAPILQDDQAIRCGPHSAEAMTICYHARVFSSASNQTLLERDGREALELLQAQPAGKISSYATPLAVTNIASLFEFGLPDNVFRQMFSAELARAAHNARPSTTSPVVISEAAKAINESESFLTTSYPSVFVVEFVVDCFNRIIRRELDHGTIRDLLQYVHVNLVFFSALLDLRIGLTSEPQLAMVEKILLGVDWACLATFLNELIKIDPISTRIEEHALFYTFLLAERSAERKPLAEDYMIRGIIWAETYLPADLFHDMEDDDGSRAIETPARLHLRAERVEWLACLIAHPEKQSPLSYDRNTRQYGTRRLEPVSARRSSNAFQFVTQQTWQKKPTSPVVSESSATMSRRSSPTEDYDMMSMQSDNQSQMAPSTETRRTEATTSSYVRVPSANFDSIGRRENSKHTTEVGGVMIIDGVESP